MKKRKTSTSGEVRSDHQKYGPVIGPRCQRATIACPVAASTAIPAANESQKPTAIHSSFRRERINRPPATITANANSSHAETGPHQKSSGSARSLPSNRKQSTSPMFDGLKTWLPRHLIAYFERSETAAVTMKIHHPFVLHQSPWRVPGTRKMNATPLPVSIALAGHIRTCCLRKVIAISSTAQVSTEMRIWAIETRNWKTVWPSTWSVVITTARCSLGSLGFGSKTGYGVPRIVSVRPAGAGAAGALIARSS